MLDLFCKVKFRMMRIKIALLTGREARRQCRAINVVPMTSHLRDFYLDTTLTPRLV
jgi:hypothetical protein